VGIPAAKIHGVGVEFTFLVCRYFRELGEFGSGFVKTASIGQHDGVVAPGLAGFNVVGT
jgi:hypothetical protein